jgi:arachidonate 15-lipoxygenase
MSLIPLLLTFLASDEQADDAGRSPTQRKKAIAKARTDYEYDYDLIEGLPLVKTVPLSELPSLEWLWDVAEVALKLLVNTLLAKPGNTAFSRENQGIYFQLLQRLKVGNRQQIEETLQELNNFVESQKASGSGDSFAEYNNLFKAISIPTVSKNLLFQQDLWFAWQRVAGPNPVVIERVLTQGQIFITESVYQGIIPGESLQATFEKGRLYLTDYSRLISLAADPGTGKYITTPKALFVVKERVLIPLAIQIDSIILTPDADYWSWQIAKTLVQIADSNYHELISHLGQTHLVVEPFVIATHRQLAANHPLSVLLLPHFEGTLFINDQAQSKLIGKGGSVDQLLAGSIDASRKLTIEAFQTFDFNNAFLPVAIKARGVEDTNTLPVYPYRDDGLLIWNAIHQWVSDYARVYYPDDDKVKADEELQAWVKELQNEGRIKNIGEDGAIKTFNYLIDTLTLIIFTASAQHAAVNFPQGEIMSYAPAFPLAGYTPAPKAATGGTQAEYFDLLPPIDKAQGQLNLTYLLGTFRYTHLGEYKAILDPRVQQYLSNFQSELKAIELKIKERNLGRFVPYPFLQPSLIPQSINI